MTTDRVAGAALVALALVLLGFGALLVALGKESPGWRPEGRADRGEVTP